MITTLLGTKHKMTQVYTKDGKLQAACILRIEPNVVLDKRTSKHDDGTNPVVIGTGKKKKASKSLQGLVKKAGLENAPQYTKEITAIDTVKVGQEIRVSDVFTPGDLLTIQGTSKGKGFAGVVKKWGFSGGPATHGQSDRHRAPGSIGAGTDPSRVLKGKKMAGRMGGNITTMSNLVVLKVLDDGLIVRGSVPGARNSKIVISKVGTLKGFAGITEETVEQEVKNENSETNQK